MSARSDKTTWHGTPDALEPPFGATVVVHRRHQGSHQFLVLHRAHEVHVFDGEWAWTPPSGARYPGEEIVACAKRELLEETGLDLELVPIERGSLDWRVFAALLPEDQAIHLSDEHDRYQWVGLERALEMCKPDQVASAVESAAHAIGLT